MPKPSASGFDVIRIDGLKEFQNALRYAGSELGAAAGSRPLADAAKQAAKVVVDEARGRARSLGGVAGKSAPSILTAAQQLRSKVTIGGPRHPYALGAEFGGQRRPTTQQFEPWRGKEGYFLYPAIRDTRDEFMDAYTSAIDQIMRRAFPD